MTDVGTLNGQPLSRALPIDVVPAPLRIGETNCGGGSGITSEYWRGTLPKLRIAPMVDNPL
jgi:hypothetical protein